MGTRGFLGFVADGQEKIAYNHSDSYPEGLGIDMLGWLRFAAQDVAQLRERVQALRVVNPDVAPTAGDVERLAQWTDVGVAERSTDSWYCLLHGTQGNPAAMLQAGAIEDASGFPLDSLFAEWGYIVDLDSETFEVYRGFQKSAHDKGRFASREPHRPSHRAGDYFPCALVAGWPLADLPGDDVFFKTFMAEEDD